MKIPVIGTAIVNGVHWLQRLLDSVDYPVENFVIFNNNGKGEITEKDHKVVKAEIKIMGTSVNGAVSLLIMASNSLVVWVSFSTKSHLLTKMTIPFLFFSASQKIF